MRKKPKYAYAKTIAERSPRVDPNIRAGSDHLAPVWHIRFLSENGDYSWNGVPVNDLKGYLGRFEAVTWAELKRKGCHPISSESICTVAKQKLMDINQDEGELYSMRIDGRKRILGIRSQQIFKILWWDPEHAICPSYKKHT